MPRVKRCRANGCHEMVSYESRYCKRHQDLEQQEKPKRDYRRYNQVTRNRDDRKISQYHFYRTRRWVALRQSTLEKQNYLCQYCLVDGIVTPAKTVDHCIPIEADPSLASESNNLAVVCPSCHSKKTKWEQRYYGTGKDNTLRQVIAISSIKTINKMMNDTQGT